MKTRACLKYYDIAVLKVPKNILVSATKNRGKYPTKYLLVTN